jgi:hypothetical protein
VPAPGEVDEELGEFWEGDPWRISNEHNLSGYERNRAYLNVVGGDFLDISYLTGADSDGDGRSAVAADLNGDGRQDLVVRQAGGGALLVYENRFPPRHWLKVSLTGVDSNRLGIGARLTARVAGRQIVRELYPVNSYRSQAPSLVHFGLGDAEVVESLTIRWPSGLRQTLKGLRADRHIVVREGSDEVLPVSLPLE